MIHLTLAPVFLPGPRPLPLLGWRGSLAPFIADPIGYMRNVQRNYGTLAAISRAEPLFLFAFEPTHNRQILSDATLFHSNPGGRFAVPPDSSLERIASGLLSMNGTKHQQQRRLMMPAFHRKQIVGYRDAMVQIAQRQLERWQPGQTLDIAHEMQQITLEIALKTLFSLEATPEAIELGELFKQSLELSFSPVDALIQVDLPGTGYRRLLRLAGQIEARVRQLIEQRSVLRSEANDVLATLIDARDEDGGRLSDAELIGQTYTLFAAGHETSSNALTWTLLLLEQHPETLAALVDELTSELQGEAPQLEQLERLPLLDRVVKESLRLMPPATVLGRISTAPFTLQCYELPAGTTVFVSPYITHRLPELYDQPQHFLPQRWETLVPGTYSYLPFGAGPRMCIGATFATMEIKLVLALLLQRYRLALTPGAQVDREVRITLRPRNGLPMRVYTQDRQFASQPVRGTIRQMIDLT